MNQNRNDFLKLLAALLMVLDHVGAIFFPYLLYLRIPGRLSFPIFAYYTALGGANTKNPKGYFCKLLVMALITQPIYQALLPGHLNILFTLLYGAAVVYLFHQQKPLPALLAVCLLGGSFVITEIDYGAYGILTIFLFYLTLNKPVWSSYILQGLLQVGNHLFSYSHPIQAFSVAALPLIHCKKLPHVTLPRYFFYAFYPLHLCLLLLIRIL